MRGDRVLATLTVLLIGAPVVLVTYALLARFVLHGEVNGRSLGRSVARESPWPGSGVCRRSPAPNEWRCDLSDGSTTRTYRVRIRDGSSCWEARRPDVARSEPFSGCVHRWQRSLL